ncbi:MAG: sugar phosphate isomerase/epimerase [Clostridia bacterium]|nr:sugar phosphate isomerase/epimerase [Clostridia bacterium]
MNSFRLGLTSTTFKKKSIGEIVDIAKRANAEYIEWGERFHVNSVEDAEKAKALCDKAGIKICSYGSYYAVGSADKEKWAHICRVASAMAADSIRVWLGKKNSEDTSAQEYAQLLADAESMCEEAAKYGLDVCAECHDNTFNNNTDAILKFTKELGRENFRTYFQSRYFRFAYDLDRIDRTYDIIENVHVSYSEVTREQRFRKKDKKYLDALLVKLKEKNFGGIVMIEFTRFASARQFLKDMKKLKRY